MSLTIPVTLGSGAGPPLSAVGQPRAFSLLNHSLTLYLIEISWAKIRNELITPFLDIDLKYYDLGLEYR